MIELNSRLKDYSLSIPTSVKEITPESLKLMTDNLHLMDHYCVIALVHKLKLFNLAATINGKNNSGLAVVPLIAKVNTPNKEIKDKLEIGYRAIVTRSSIEMGIHYNSPANDINLIAVNNYINDDKDLRNDIFTGEYFKQDGKSLLDSKSASPECCFIEFKILPLSAIAGAYPIGNELLNPHVHPYIKYYKKVTN